MREKGQTAEVVEKFVLTDADRALIEKFSARLDHIAAALAMGPGTIFTDLEERLRAVISNAVHAVDEESVEHRAAFLKTIETKGFQKILAKLSAVGAAALPPERPVRAELRGGVPPTPRQAPGTRRPVRPSADSDGALGKGQRKILTAIAQHDGGVTRGQLTVLTGYKKAIRDTYLQQLQQQGLIAPNGHGTLVATDAGLEALGPDFEALPTGDLLREYWLQRLPQGERILLEALVGAYPKMV